MYPFKDDFFAPLNRWYVAAWSSEIGRTPLERWIMDAPVAFYRKESGEAVAVDGRCPHHLFPLAQGALVGDDIRCGYHGLQFAPDGRCVASPFLSRIPPACRIKSYAVAERWQWLWIWPGDPALADESLIPDHAEIGLLDDAYLSVPGSRIDVAARYQLLNDNLLDLQHVEVLHSKHIGNDGMGRVTEETDAGDEWVSSRRLQHGVTIPPVMAQWFGEGLADREVQMTFHAPGLHSGSDTFTGAAESDKPGAYLGKVNVYHAVTPAKQLSCHYFTAIGRDFARDNAALTAGMVHKLATVIEEDRVASEGIEGNLGARDRAPREMLFASDKTVVQGRRVLERMMAAELPQPVGSPPVGKKLIAIAAV